MESASTEWIAVVIAAFLTGLGGFITAVVTARNSAKQADVAALTANAQVAAQEVKTLAETAAQEAKTLAEAREANDLSIGREFAWLRSEIDRLQESLGKRRTEIERLWDVEKELRQALVTRDQEMIALRLELSTERAVSNAQSKRISELELRLSEVSGERDLFISAMKQAGIELPTPRRRGDTGPLGPANPEF